MTYKANDRDRAQVKALTGFGLDQEQISEVIGISRPTLRKYYRKELDSGMLVANAKVAESLFRQATDPEKPNVVAGIFWMKARAGWKDRPAEESQNKKDIKEKAAKDATKGRFSQSPPPLELVKKR